jgi:hypothetical protein
VQRPTIPVEEDEVEREAHPARVDAAAARDQQAEPSLLAGQQRQPEQARAQAVCLRHLATEHLDPRQVSKAARLHIEAMQPPLGPRPGPQ